MRQHEVSLGCAPMALFMGILLVVFLAFGIWGLAIALIVFGLIGTFA